MIQFIAVTSLQTGDIIRVNLDRIETYREGIETKEFSIHTKLFLVGDDENPLLIKESASAIDALVNLLRV